MSQNSDILAYLSDGEWKTVAEIHRACGFSRLNSRISELRARGHDIECEHIRGAGTGSHAYRYRLATKIVPKVTVETRVYASDYASGQLPLVVFPRGTYDE